MAPDAADAGSEPRSPDQAAQAPAEQVPAPRQPSPTAPSSLPSKGQSMGSQHGRSAGAVQPGDTPLHGGGTLEELAAAAEAEEALAGDQPQPRRQHQQGPGQQEEPAPKRQRPGIKPEQVPPLPTASSPPRAPTPLGPTAAVHPAAQAPASPPLWSLPALPALRAQTTMCSAGVSKSEAAAGPDLWSAFTAPAPRAVAQPPMQQQQQRPQLQLLQDLLGLAPAPAPATPVVPMAVPPAQAPGEGLLTALQSGIVALLQAQQQAAERQRQAAERQRQAAEQQEGLLKLLFQLAAPAPPLPTLQLPPEPGKPLQAAVQLLLQGLASRL